MGPKNWKDCLQMRWLVWDKYLFHRKNIKSLFLMDMQMWSVPSVSTGQFVRKHWLEPNNLLISGSKNVLLYHCLYTSQVNIAVICIQVINHMVAKANSAGRWNIVIQIIRIYLHWCINIRNIIKKYIIQTATKTWQVTIWTYCV